MTVGTAINVSVEAVAECYRPGAGHRHQHISRPVASGTVGQGERILPFVTGSAGLAPLHLRHADRAVSPRFEEAWMASVAGQLFCVGGMDKGNITGWLDLECDISDGMAASTV